MKLSCDLPLAGLQKTTMVDFPGVLSAMVFTPGCNYDCFYCHNRELLDKPPLLDTDEVMAYLEKRRPLLDGVVVSGGEPTLHRQLKPFMARLKEMGFLTKLDTNGSRPDVLGELLTENLVDYVAMDYKAPLALYPEICRHSAEGLVESLTLLKAWDPEKGWELRTTVVPQFTLETLMEMAPIAREAPAWYLQVFNKPPVFRPEDRFRVEAAAHTAAQLDELARSLVKLAPNVKSRG